MKYCLTAFVFALVSSAFAQTPIADWAASSQGDVSHGLRLLTGSDGVVSRVTRGGSPCATTEAASAYLYFAVDAGIKTTGPLYLIVDYYDDNVGGALTAEYDAGPGIPTSYTRCEDGAGGLAFGRRKWATCGLLLRKPDFAGRQNIGASFRLSGMPLFVRSVQMLDRKPTNWEGLKEAIPKSINPLVKIGKGGELIAGAFDPAKKSDVSGLTRSLEANILGLKQLGFTSNEVYVRWNLCEVAPGVYDWSVYDPYVALYKKYGFKWVPFLIVGSPYSLPDWYFNGDERQGYVCLEHGLESHVQSLWNPAMRQHVKSFIKAFADHYRDSSVIESMLLGISGNYGEALYVITGNDWTNSVHGEYHTHPGYWAGDKYAVASFRSAVERKYLDVAHLNAAWKTKFASFDDVKPFVPRGKEWSNRAKLDFIDWYIGSMTDYTRLWLTETRANMPKTPIYLCTGGHAPPEHGSDFAEQCKAAAAVKGGVRITNEASDYNLNFALTRWVASASRQYGAYFSFEPASGVTPSGVVARIYNATASGAKGLHYYLDNVFGSPAARDAFVANGSEFQQRKPVTEVGLFYPETDIRLNDQFFFQKVMPLRNVFDPFFICDSQIADGGLQRVKALVFLSGTIAEQETWSKIARWVRNGGLLLYARGIGQPVTVEGAPSEIAPLLAAGADTGKGRVVMFDGKPDTVQYRAFLLATLSKAPELSEAARKAIAAGSEGVFVTLCGPDAWHTAAYELWYNATDKPVERTALNGKRIDIPAHGIR